jgi:hypothetical protein
LTGYALDNTVALKLESALSGIPDPPSVEGRRAYPSFIRDNIMKDLRKDLKNKGLNFEVDVKFVGTGHPWITLIATQGVTI